MKKPMSAADLFRAVWAAEARAGSATVTLNRYPADGPRAAKLRKDRDVAVRHARILRGRLDKMRGTK